jgi:hypothetical protein
VKRPTPLPGMKAGNFAYKAMKSLGFVNLNRMFEPRGAEPAAPVTCVGRPAEVLHGRSGPQPLLRVLRPNPPEPQLISQEDWDVMFRAVQMRLVAAVGDRPDSARAPAEGDAAGHVQVAVLECVTAMAQLHAALKHQRD